MKKGEMIRRIESLEKRVEKLQGLLWGLKLSKTSFEVFTNTGGKMIIWDCEPETAYDPLWEKKHNITIKDIVKTFEHLYDYFGIELKVTPTNTKFIKRNKKHGISV